MTQDALYNFVHQLNTSYVGPSLVFVLLLSGGIDAPQGLVGIQLMQSAFNQTFGAWGNWFIALSLFFFALSTIVAILWLSPQVAQEVKKMRSQKS